MAKALGLAPASRTPGPSRSTGWGGGRRPRPRQDDHAIPADVLDWPPQVRGLPPAPRHPLRRHGDLRPARWRGVPGRVGADGEPLGAAVGQGRLRRGRVWSSSTCWASACSRRCTYAVDLIARAPRRATSTWPRSPRRTRSTTCSARPTPSACSRSRAARQMATLPRLRPRTLLRPGGRGRADPPRPDPGRVGAPLHPPAQRRGAGHLPAPAAREVARQDPRRAAVPGAADADGDRRRPGSPPPRPTSCVRRWAPSAATSGWSGCRQRLYEGMASSRASPATWPTRSARSWRRSPTSASPRATR